MKTLLHLVLLFGALIGLLGQSTAMAMAPLAKPAMATMVAMADCADMADGSMRGEKPCKKITWRCIAAMGCTAAMIAEPTFTAGAPRTARLPHVRPMVAAMPGRNVAPELDPPAFSI